jgi:SanA protein
MKLLLNRRFIILFLLTFFILSATAIYFSNREIENIAGNKLFDDVKLIPENHVGLLLGTSKFLGFNHKNEYYFNRIEAARILMLEGKIHYLVISGDNSTEHYNEPQMMKQDLVLAGINPSRIYLDFAGFRTFDSVVRLKEIFCQSSVTIISQRFHNERAVYIAEKEGLHAIAFNATDVTYMSGFKTNAREKLARVKVFVDYFFRIKPKFLGEKIHIPQ